LTCVARHRCLETHSGEFQSSVCVGWEDSENKQRIYSKPNAEQ